MSEKIRPVIRQFLFWAWHADVPTVRFCNTSSICCGERMKQYEFVDQSGPPKNRIARCMDCGRQFSFEEDPRSGGDVDVWYKKIADTNYEVVAA